MQVEIQVESWNDGVGSYTRAISEAESMSTEKYDSKKYTVETAESL